MTRIAAVGSVASVRGTDPSARHPMIVANPSSDQPFRSMIERFLLSGGRFPKDLEAMLRTRYPSSVVRQRGLSGERLEVWYVYRDGHWTWSSDHESR